MGRCHPSKGKQMTREDIIRMADASGLSYYGMGKDRERFIAHLQRFADLVADSDRWAILELVDSYAKNNTDLADAIRARGNT